MCRENSHHLLKCFLVFACALYNGTINMSEKIHILLNVYKGQISCTTPYMTTPIQTNFIWKKKQWKKTSKTECVESHALVSCLCV